MTLAVAALGDCSLLLNLELLEDRLATENVHTVTWISFPKVDGQTICRWATADESAVRMQSCTFITTYIGKAHMKRQVLELFYLHCCIFLLCPQKRGIIDHTIAFVNTSCLGLLSKVCRCEKLYRQQKVKGCGHGRSNHHLTLFFWSLCCGHYRELYCPKPADLQEIQAEIEGLRPLLPPAVSGMHLQVVRLDAEELPILPTLQGWLLGYPIVYLVSERNIKSASRLLSTEGLLLFSLSAACQRLQVTQCLRLVLGTACSEGGYCCLRGFQRA